MTNLADLLPAGGGQNNTDFVADGAISSGAPVVLTAAGKAAAVGVSSGNEGIGTPVVFDATDSISGLSSAYDSNSNKIVVVYGGNGGTGYAIVGTISGTSVSFGTRVAFDSDNSESMAITFDSNSNKIVIAYRYGQFPSGTYGYGYGIVGTVSGTSISFGTKVAFNSASTTNIGPNGIDFDSTANKVVIAYRDDGNSDYGTAIVGTVSGTSISFGSEATIETGQTSYHSVTYDSNTDRTVIAYRHDAGSGYGKAKVGQVSGTSITLGVSANFEGASTNFVGSDFDSSQNKIVIAYSDAGNSSYGTGIVGTVTGGGTNTIAFGAAEVFNSASTGPIAKAVFDTNLNKTIVAYCNSVSPFNGFAVRGTVSGTGITFSTPFLIASTQVSGSMTLSFDASTNNLLFSYADVNSTPANNGEAVVYTDSASNLTSTNLLGIASGAISDTATGKINTWGSRNEAAFAALATGSTTNLTGKTQSPYPDITYDITQGKFVVFFEDANNSNYGTAVVVTVSGSTVSFGTPVVFNSGTTIALGATYSQANGRHVVVYPNYSDSQKATAAVGTVSGTSISFGTPVVFDSTITNTQCSVAYNSTLGKYLAGAMTSTIKVTVLTVDPSDNSITFGTPVSLTGTRYYPNIVSNESASDFVLTNNLNDNQAEAQLISVSGTTPTVEDTETISSVVSTSYPRTGLVFLESNKFVCVTSEFNTNSMFTRTITVSGTSLSIGTQSSAFTVDYDSQTTINGRWPLFFASTTEAYLYYQDDTSNYLKYVPITISGTTATGGTELTYYSTAVAYSGFGYNSSTKQSLSFFQDSSQTKGLAQNGALVIGTDYYVQTDGSLSTDTSGQLIGQAITTTQINIKDYTG